MKLLLDRLSFVISDTASVSIKFHATKLIVSIWQLVRVFIESVVNRRRKAAELNASTKNFRIDLE
jgi:hypothetical protein